MPHWAVRLEGKVNEVLESQRRIEVAVEGTDENPTLGLRMKVDRLEQAELRRNVLVGTAITAGVGAVVATAWAKLTGKA
jgi:Zn-dependent alcohol dehydrogenase